LAYSASSRGYACNLENSYSYLRSPEWGQPYHILKLIVEFQAIRAAHNLPNPHHATAAYLNSVQQIFRSQVVDVSLQIRNAGVQRMLSEDLQPVLDELQQQKIVE
jgi:hypothetical protein